MMLNISQAAKTAGVARNTIYAKLKSGEISATLNHDGNKEISVSDLVRVFGELKGEVQAEQSGFKRPEQQVIPGLNVTGGVVDALRDQVELLKVQVAEAKEREVRLMNMIEEKDKVVSSFSNLVVDQRCQRSRSWFWWPWQRVVMKS